MEEVKERQTKVCKCCGQEKPVNEFNKSDKNKNGDYTYRKICKVCQWMNRHTEVVIKENWTIKEYEIIVDMLLNNKVQCINDIILMLRDKSLEELVTIIKNYLKVRATRIRVLVSCQVCKQNKYITISQYIKQHNYFCSIKCKSMYQLNSFNVKNGFSYCKQCHKEKPINYFWKNNYGNPRSVCKTCMYLDKHQIINTDKWSSIEIHILIEFILNQNETYSVLNHVLQKLNNKTINDIITFIQINHLEFSSKPLKFNKHCATCGREIMVDLRKNKNKNFCSIQCAGKYYSKHYSGENHWLYDRLHLKCNYCGKDIYLTHSREQNGKKHFCNEKCRNQWFKEVYVQTDEFKIRNKEIMLSNLRTGKISTTNTSIQRKVNEMLKELSISYENEKTIGYYSIDNYLHDSQLIIEVNGDYWHCNPVVYQNIVQLPQYKSILRDKRKTTYTKKYLNTNILFLWESDINNKPQLCKKLIIEYIDRHGLLDNYDSFNYDIDDKSNLLLKHNKFIPYREYNKDELKNIMQLEIQQKIYRRDESKWVKYKCEYCGQECQSLYSHYKKSKHHYCSTICANKMKTANSNISVRCHNCNKEMYIPKSIYLNNKTKIFYCDEKCKHYDTSVIVECYYCNEKFVINKSKYEKSKSKHFFCNREHWKLYQQNKKTNTTE